MKKTSAQAILAVAALFGSGAASADQNLWVGAKVGTLGAGVELAWRPLPWFDVRGGFSQFTFDDTGSQAGVNYDSELKLENAYATANFRFPLSPMRFTAGLFTNGNELELVSQEATAIEIGGTVYPAAAVGTIESVTSFDGTAPYAGVGFDFDLFGKVGLNLDLGVLWQGDPDVTLTNDGILANDPTFQAELEEERQELVAEVEDYKAWPVLTLGFTYKFL